MNTAKALLGILTITTALTICSQAQAFLNDGLVAYYPFDGNANDASGNGNNGAMNDATFTTNRFGDANSACALDGKISSRVTFNSSNLLVQPPFSCSFWMQYNGGVGNPRIVSWSGWEVNIDWPNVPRGINYNNNTTTGLYGLSSVGITLLGSWHQIVAIRTTNAMQLYIDGKLNSTTATSGDLIYANGLGVNWLQTIGGPSGIGYANDFFAGNVDDVRIYNRALSSNEVAQLFLFESTPSFALPFLQVHANLHFSLQGETNITGQVATIAQPDRSKWDAKDILSVLAHDEFLKGNWPSEQFPKSASLNLVSGSFCVLDGTNYLLNVSDLLSYTVGNPSVVSGKQNISTGLAAYQIQKSQLATIAFDDTAITNGYELKFQLHGLAKEITQDSNPTSGTYSESKILTIPILIGDGYTGYMPFTVSGTLSALGNANLQIPN